jgi:hypothetical protein
VVDLSPSLLEMPRIFLNEIIIDYNALGCETNDTLGRELYRVPQQVDHNLSEPLAISHEFSFQFAFDEISFRYRRIIFDTHLSLIER